LAASSPSRESKEDMRRRSVPSPTKAMQRRYASLSRTAGDIIAVSRSTRAYTQLLANNPRLQLADVLRQTAGFCVAGPLGVGDVGKSARAAGLVELSVGALRREQPCSEERRNKWKSRRRGNSETLPAATFDNEPIPASHISLQTGGCILSGFGLCLDLTGLPHVERSQTAPV
jgi:hypothetical protein